MSAAVMEQNLPPQTSILDFFSSPKSKSSCGYSQESESLKGLSVLPLGTSTPKPGKGVPGKKNQHAAAQSGGSDLRTSDEKEEIDLSQSGSKSTNATLGKDRVATTTRAKQVESKAGGSKELPASKSSSGEVQTDESVIILDVSEPAELEADAVVDESKTSASAPSVKEKVPTVKRSKCERSVKVGKRKGTGQEPNSDKEEDTSYDCDYSNTLTEGETDSGLIHEQHGPVTHLESAKKKRKKKKKKVEELDSEDEAQKVEKLVATMTHMCSKAGKKKKAGCTKWKCDCMEPQTSTRKTVDSYFVKYDKKASTSKQSNMEPAQRSEEKDETAAKQKLSLKRDAAKSKKTKATASKPEACKDQDESVAEEDSCTAASQEEKAYVEMSFEEYMSALSAHSEEEKTSENERVEHAQGSSGGEDSEAGKKLEKGDVAYPSVIKFFTRVKEKPVEKSCAEKGETKTVTVKADVHPPPEVPRKGRKGKGRRQHSAKRASPVNESNVNQTDDIEILSSEVMPASEEKKMPADKSSTAKLPTTQCDSEIEQKENKMSSVEDKKCLVINVEKKLDFLKSADPVKFVKGSQATLSFGQNGLEMNTSKLIKLESKSGPELDEGVGATPNEGENVEEEKSGVVLKTRRHGKRGRRKKKAAKTASPAPIPASTPPTLETESTPKDKHDEHDGPSVRRSTRKKTHTSTLQYEVCTPTRRKRTTLDTEDHNESLGTSDFTPKSAKTAAKSAMAKKSRAQELLKKAKQRQSSKSKAPELKLSPVVVAKRKRQAKQWEKIMPSRPERTQRHSAQLAGQLIHMQQNEVIVIDGIRRRASEDVKPSGKDRSRTTSARKRRLSDAVDVEEIPEPASRKASQKVAPIFMMGKGGKQEAKPKAPPEDPEKVRQRQAFLMSGIPEELKKQAEASNVMALQEFPPLPAVSHVLQPPHPLPDVWRLPSVPLPLSQTGTEPRQPPRVAWSAVLSPDWKQQDASRSLQTLKNFVKHPETDIKPLLQEIQQHSKSFSVQEMYDRLKAKQQAVEKPENNTATKSESEPVAVPVEETPKSTRKSRRRMRKRAASPDCVVVEEATTVPEVMTPPSKDLLWTEVFQASEACEVVGNVAAVRRLRSWLVDWRQQIQREASKMKRRLQHRKTARPAEEKSSQGWGDEDSDFDFESNSDSEEDSSRLCNSTLLVGPHGIGKTMAVYALAKELGFKVFEVNASSLRSGKRILSQLQEATQSHQVGQNKEGATPPFATPPSATPPSGRPSPAERVREEKTAKMPAAFRNLFKAGGSKGAIAKPASKKTKVEVIDLEKPETPAKRSRGQQQADKKPVSHKPGSKHKSASQPAQSPVRKARKPGKEEESSSQAELNLTGSLSLTSTSLILFDEVDLVLESDKGFLQAVQQFMEVTKIPIVMTTTAANFTDHLQSRVEVVQFKTPSFSLIGSFLQTLCLVHGVRTSQLDILNLVSLLGGDVRRCMLALQFWLHSGGGRVQAPRRLAPCPPETSKTGAPDSQGTESSCMSPPKGSHFGQQAGSGDDDDDFVSLRPAVRPRRRLLVDDDNDAEKEASALRVEDKGEVETEEVGEGPVVHCQCLESVLCLETRRSMQSTLTSALQAQSDLSSAVEMSCALSRLHDNLCYSNLLHFLPLPHAPPDPREPCPALPTTSVKPSGFRRIKDLFDSEGSDEENSSDKPRAEVDEKPSAADSGVLEDAEMKAVGEEGAPGPTEGERSQSTASAVEDEVDMRETSEEVMLLSWESTSDVSRSEGLNPDGKGQGREAETAAVSDSRRKNDSSEQTAGGDGSKDAGSLPASLQTKDEEVEPEGVGESQASTAKARQMPSSAGLLEKRELSAEKRCELDMLVAMATYHNTLSEMDTMASQHQQRDLDQPLMLGGHRSSLEAGLQDHLTLYSASHWWSGITSCDLTSDLQVRATRRLCAEVKDIASSYRKAHPDRELPAGCCVPEVRGNCKFSLCRNTGHLPSLTGSMQRAVENVSASLPLSGFLQRPTLHLDYLPTLRQVGRTMQLRRQAKTKRRFHHYFDQIGLNLKETTLNVLCTEFSE